MSPRSLTPHHLLPKSREGLVVVAGIIMMLGMLVCINLGMIVARLLPIEWGWIPVGAGVFLALCVSIGVSVYFELHVDHCVDMKSSERASKR